MLLCHIACSRAEREIQTLFLDPCHTFAAGSWRPCSPDLSCTSGNDCNRRTSVILDIEKPTVREQWGDVGAGVVRIGNLKLHIGDCGQLQRPGDWSRQDPDANVTNNEPTTFCTHENMNTSKNCAPYQLFDVRTRGPLPLIFLTTHRAKLTLAA